MDKRLATLVSHTHWDREWYLSLEDYRFRLVTLLDGLLEILADEEDYHSFWLDGQTIPIEDYLAVRPEKRGAIEQALRSGRLLIGPWYVQADEFIVAGEACLRNLALGMDQMREAGQDNRVGYLADNFGHPSQMPQILRGFGIDNAVFWRGCRPESLEGAEQDWTGAGGSRVIAVCLVCGYSNAGRLLAVTDPENTDDKEPERLPNALEILREACRQGPILLMNGVDHSLPIRRLGEHLRKLMEVYPDLDVRHGSLVEYVEELRGKSLPADLPEGELTNVPRLASTGSSRLPQKLANCRAEDLLIHYAEPLSALASRHGRAPAPGFLRRAWRFVIKNHAHDSISGSHTNAVAEDVMRRFRRAEEVGRGIVRQCLGGLCGQSAETVSPVEPTSVWVYNPCGWRREGPVEMTLELPMQEVFQGVSLFRDGKVCPIQTLSVETRERIRYHKQVNPTRDEVHEVRILANLGGPEATTLERFEISLAREPAAQAAASPAWGVLDNGILRATVHDDGRLDITDLGSGLEAFGLNRLTDEPDKGDLYQSAQPVGAARAAAERGTLERVEAGPLRTAYRVRTRVASGQACIPVTITLSLAKGEPYVRIRTDVDNTAENHRLRAVFPAPDGFDRVWAHTPFDVVERRPPEPDKRPFRAAGDVRYEFGGTTLKTQGLVATRGERGALYVLTRGLYEYDMPRGGPLSVTLLRCTGLIFPQFTMFDSSSGQCLGKIALEYAVGLSGPSTRADLLKRALEFRLRPITYQVFGDDLPGDPSQICSVSEEDWILSSVKPAGEGDGVVVRLFSLADGPRQGDLQLGFPVARAFRTRLDETRLDETPVTDGRIHLELGPREIATLLLLPT